MQRINEPEDSGLSGKRGKVFFRTKFEPSLLNCKLRKTYTWREKFSRIASFILITIDYLSRFDGMVLALHSLKIRKNLKRGNSRNDGNVIIETFLPLIYGWKFFLSSGNFCMLSD